MPEKVGSYLRCERAGPFVLDTLKSVEKSKSLTSLFIVMTKRDISFIAIIEATSIPLLFHSFMWMDRSPLGSSSTCYLELNEFFSAGIYLKTQALR